MDGAKYFVCYIPGVRFKPYSLYQGWILLSCMLNYLYIPQYFNLLFIKTDSTTNVVISKHFKFFLFLKIRMKCQFRKCNAFSSIQYSIVSYSEIGKLYFVVLCIHIFYRSSEKIKSPIKISIKFHSDPDVVFGKCEDLTYFRLTVIKYRTKFTFPICTRRY